MSRPRNECSVGAKVRIHALDEFDGRVGRITKVHPHAVIVEFSEGGLPLAFSLHEIELINEGELPLFAV